MQPRNADLRECAHHRKLTCFFNWTLCFIPRHQGEHFSVLAGYSWTVTARRAWMISAGCRGRLCQRKPSLSVWCLMAGVSFLARVGALLVCRPPPPLNRPLTAGQITDHWALTALCPPVWHTFFSKSHCSYSREDCTAPPVPTSSLTILNVVISSPLSLSLSHLSLSLSLVVCSVGSARATAVKACVKQLCKQTAEDLCRPLDIACLLTAAPISSLLMSGCEGIMKSENTWEPGSCDLTAGKYSRCFFLIVIWSCKWLYISENSSEWQRLHE